MPKSKVHSKRRAKQKKRKESFEALINKRVAKFNELPEETKLGLLAQWQRITGRKRVMGVTGGLLSGPKEEIEDGSTSGEAT